MLVVIFGVSCAGKSTIIEGLLDYGYNSVRVYTTRALRNGEYAKIHVSYELFEQYLTQHKFAFVNQFFNTKYGTSNEDISKALSSNDVYLLDYALSRETDFARLDCLKVILLRENLDTLILQIRSANRHERLDEILHDYKTNYSQAALSNYLNRKFKLVINHHSNPEYAVMQINNYIKMEVNHGGF